jgi:transposase
MAMLADTVELVIGVDTHKDTHTAAVVAAATGAVFEQVTVSATPAGYQQLLRLADRHDGQRVWAIEGTGGDGVGLTRFLQAHGEQVVELDWPQAGGPPPRRQVRSPGRDQGRPRSPEPRPARQPRAAGHRAALSVRLTARR